MQQTPLCTTCGAEISSEARFCRKCGQPSPQFNPDSVTEGTTRLLETPERPASFHQNVYEHPGGLAQATNRLPPQASPTSRSLEPNRKPTNWLLISSMIVAAIALIVTGLFITLRNRPATIVSPPVVTRPDVPPGLPVPPPPPPGTTQGSGISRALVYPGAETTMEVTDVSEGNVLQLQTSDSFDKVVNWYMEKLKPTKVVRIPNSNVILEAGEIKAIINADDAGTMIMLAQGED
jgi:hypothetical protein